MRNDDDNKHWKPRPITAFVCLVLGMFFVDYMDGFLVVVA